MAGLMKNKFIYENDRLDFSRSLFHYEKRHSTNLLSGMIVPVHHQFLYPGDSPDYNFGCVIESAPLISTCLDNIYVDIITIWTPVRLVMTDWNEFLGESNTQAFTINRNITIPKILTVKTGVDAHYGTDIAISRPYLADQMLAPHIGYRLYGSLTNHQFTPVGGSVVSIPTDSKFYKGINILPSRVYDLNWNTFFRNENVQTPILISKTSTVSGTDSNYEYGLGHLHMANKLKSWFTNLTPAPSLLDVSIALDELLPVQTGDRHSVSGYSAYHFSNVNTDTRIASALVGVDSAKNVQGFAIASGNTTQNIYIAPDNLWANTSSLTVNRMYYALMEQRFANKMMKGRRAVEFYANFFGVQHSDAGYDLPKLLCQKRYPLNISQVISTTAGTDGTDSNPLGQRGAFSTTGFGDSLVKNFLATEHGYLMTYMIIRGQPSISEGIDAELGIDALLDTYIPEFDHIGPVGVETLEVVGPKTNTMLGYTNAWYSERNPVSDCAGIVCPGEALEYKTLAIDYNHLGGTSLVVSDYYLKHWPSFVDRIFLYPVCYGTSTGPGQTTFNYMGEAFASNRYQFITQFVVKGKIAKVMSPDSEPLKLRL